MTILCTIDLLTREVFLPADQRIASYDHNVDVIRFQAEPIEDFSLDLSSIKVAAKGPNKARHDYAVDPSTVQIEEETGYITFDWPIPQGVTEMPIGSGFKYGDKGQLIFAVCAEIIDGSTVSKAWHSDDGIITVVAHLEPESGGGEDPEEEATNAQKIGQLQTDVAVINTRVGVLGNGSPKPARTVAEMTEHDKVYLYTGSETGYTAGNWYFWNGSAWTSGGTYGGAVTSTTFDKHGVPADDFAVGQALAGKADSSDVTALDTRVTAVDGDILELQDGGYVADQQKIAEKISDWLEEHPEATTTVQDGSLTYEKLVIGTLGFVTPEMFGAKGDGTTDDTVPVQNAIDSGIAVMLNGNSVYKVSEIIIGEGCYLNGNGATILGTGSGDLITVNTYESSQIHTSKPIYICDLFLENANRLLVIDKGLKVTIENIVLRTFNIGCDFKSGYECILNNFRYEGDFNNTSAVGLRVGVDGGGDSIFRNFIGRDVAIAAEICSGNNIFENFHFWILTQSLFDYSVFFKENAGTDSLNKYIRPYFDSYKSLLQQNKWSASYIDSPTILNNPNVVAGECTLIDVKNSSFTDNYIATNIKITNAKFKTNVGSLCNICTNKTAPINMTYFPTSSQQWNKIAECNVESVEERIVSIPAGNVITPNNGFTIKSSNIYKDTYNSRVWGNVVIQSSLELPYDGSTIAFAIPVLIPKNAINSFCVLSDSEWKSQEVGYLYYAPQGISAGANSANKTFIKYNFDYIYN